MRYDAQGTLLWQKLLGGFMYDSFLSAAPTGDGGCILAGVSNSEDIESLSASRDYDIFVARLNGQGTVLWEKSMVSTVLDTGSAILIAPDGELVITGLYEGSCGMFKVRASDGGGIVWQADIGRDLLRLCPSHGGEYVDIGKGSYHETGWSVYAVEVVDDEGNVLWENTFDDMSYSSPAAVMRKPRGEYVLASGVTPRGPYQQTERFGSFVTLGADGAFLRRHLIGEINVGAQVKDALLTGPALFRAARATRAPARRGSIPGSGSGSRSNSRTG